ncbi:uncharacterized protein OCT59_002782 [Rhizophagus irregularis]|uniref:Myb-like domain-containing protein n=2 Tax=Rhizophagus irregularis TaxID=588596 RepID=A0A015JBF2_RHIIW|nr:hypothetical protein GLOIN_2v1483841 [Rhizophagus irregularis DAOM 181602=DAOM 197198]EXX64240.1 hypothetical protein RirG_144690 [Rhizophagus irregularis DAOM 197198w]POG64495.1 hypothetical protein GLOIN_2v1483841 [Rhizophagus irregularis DAOM 181602=DAOM 197198]UZO11210.1 hypothetical protein OCT59_002782 [Rhizophagus irregularis]GBC36435.1 hypothetical protein GLOIN_2v1483841 [Rhizophagus irregularis DAOM 181602=DAOM 197198]|eukprot:XP_025171361.1 hypothetical protein GLOIN_2v1483841 [Rhizophagus irregularis DAOM 181602=DAOM 197198]
MGSFGDRVDKIMEEFHQPMELKAVVDFLQEKKKLLSIDTNDIEKFQEIPGPNFFNLTKKEISHKSGQFNLKYAQADNILNVVDALNLIREAENKLKKVEMSVESAVKLIKNLESEQTISGETFLCNRLGKTHIGEEGTHWGFREKVALLEAVFERHLPEKLFWPDIMQRFKELTDSDRTEAACRQQWKNIGIDNVYNRIIPEKERLLEWLAKK